VSVLQASIHQPELVILNLNISTRTPCGIKVMRSKLAGIIAAKFVSVLTGFIIKNTMK
jgi:hypothetical protein